MSTTDHYPNDSKENSDGEVDEFISHNTLKRKRRKSGGTRPPKKGKIRASDREILNPTSSDDKKLKSSTSSEGDENTLFKLHNPNTQEDKRSEEVDIYTSDSPLREHEREEEVDESLLGISPLFSPIFHTRTSDDEATVSTAENSQESTEITDNLKYSVPESSEEPIEEEFDNIQFILSLPPLLFSSDMPTVLPPKEPNSPKVTLVLDLDETLVHCSIDEIPNPHHIFEVLFNDLSYKVYASKRPHLDLFMNRVAELFEVVIFTASQKVYADQLLDLIDTKSLVKHRLFRDSCRFIAGNYVKDLTVLGRDLSKTIIIDNSLHAFGYQVENGILIESWYDDTQDNELQKIIPFLEKIADSEDVRPILAKEFNLKQAVFGSPYNNNLFKSQTLKITQVDEEQSLTEGELDDSTSSDNLELNHESQDLLNSNEQSNDSQNPESSTNEPKSESQEETIPLHK